MANDFFAHVFVNELEWQSADRLAWDAEGWAGSDINQLALRSEGDSEKGASSQNELLYRRALTAFFDGTAGMREDSGPHAHRTWAGAGVEGVAPYFLAVSGTLYVSDAAHVTGKLSASEEVAITQNVTGELRLQAQLYSRAEPADEAPAWQPQLQAGVRVRYAISRRFTPYLGLTYEREQTQSVNAREGWHGLLGLRAWF
jgi:copper resistance protein B